MSTGVSEGRVEDEASITSGIDGHWVSDAVASVDRELISAVAST
jgi:hypothetical protein